MNRNHSMIVRAGLGAALLGTAAGVTEIVVGTASWLGDKNDPVTLGSVTVLLALVIGSAGWAWPWATTTPRALAVATAMLVPALLGLTTAGAAWVPAGAIAAGGAVTVLRHGVERRLIRHHLGQHWSAILLGFLAMIYLALGITARGVGGALAVSGSLVIVAVLLPCHRSRTMVALLLVIGTLPWGVVAWSSVVAPFTAALALLIGLPLVLRSDTEVVTASSGP